MSEKETQSKSETPKKDVAPKAATETKVKDAPVAKTDTAAPAVGADGAPVEKKVKRNKTKKAVQEGRVYVQSSFNNTIITITDLEGNVIAWSSAGTNGFKGAKKATPYAAQISAEAAVNKALPYGLEKVHVFVKGVGSGRDQAVRGLYTSGVSIESITDVTPIAHNGVRHRKARRV